MFDVKSQHLNFKEFNNNNNNSNNNNIIIIFIFL